MRNIFVEAANALIGGHEPSTVDEIQDRIIQLVNLPGATAGKALWDWFINLEFVPSRDGRDAYFRLEMDQEMTVDEVNRLASALNREYPGVSVNAPPVVADPSLREPEDKYAAMEAHPDETITFIIPAAAALERARTQDDGTSREFLTQRPGGSLGATSPAR